MDTYKIIIYTYPFTYNVGGILVLYNLGKILNEKYKHFDVFMYDTNNKNVINTIYNKYYNKNYNNIDDKTIIIYPEVVKGNPLNGKHIIRWILCELGINCDKNIYKTWNSTDILYFWQDYKKINVKNILCVPWINPVFKYNNIEKTETCYIIKKGKKIHNNLILSHPKNSINIEGKTLEEINNIFNKCTYFYCYDSLSCFITFSLICKCIPIVYPMENFSKNEWLNNGLHHENSVPFPDGVAYGNTEDELNFAKNTIDNASNKILDIMNNHSKSIELFNKDIIDYFNNSTSNIYHVRDFYI